MNIALLANPTAGKGRRAALLPVVVERLAAEGAAVRVVTGATAAEMASGARAAVEDGSAVVAMGGDGTVHLGLQAVAGTGVPFGIVPAGTGNDFAARLGLPADPLDAARGVAVALRDGATRAVDLARVAGADGTTAWFGAVLAAGFDAFVNERANRIRWPRGPQRYNRAIVEELLALKARRYRMSLDGDEQEFASVLVAVGNTESYGGGFRIVPDADPADGLLDVVVAEPLGRLTLMRLRPKVYTGEHVRDPRVSTYRARVIELAAEGVTAYADGERICPLPVTITCVPGALTLLT
ncbi:diacylglycerol kinase family protein [Dactylosporangium sp. AC04546]|uniref:diacylglycerol kinase family protein n=1 Tax=Dactylosporangium sp. AC04546 TaxID=2862460 RepID=UPI001EDDCF7F|nr:diacylglycerol kinase family protein [Dactylosporangium sp. AC04546]WVK80315.1 diacylglycerol kinase family protein [Dactylosporangium sp. AC04546]